MPRREYRVFVTCAHPGGCRESTTYYCTTRAEEKDARLRQRDRPWKCTRHIDPGRNLRPGNTSTRCVMVATRLPAGPVPGFPDDEDRWLPGLYWIPEGGAPGGSGYTFGDGYNAHASDFPEGTRLVVEARIEEAALGPTGR